MATARGKYIRLPLIWKYPSEHGYTALGNPPDPPDAGRWLNSPVYW